MEGTLKGTYVSIMKYDKFLGWCEDWLTTLVFGQRLTYKIVSDYNKGWRGIYKGKVMLG